MNKLSMANRTENVLHLKQVISEMKPEYVSFPLDATMFMTAGTMVTWLTHIVVHKKKLTPKQFPKTTNDIRAHRPSTFDCSGCEVGSLKSTCPLASFATSMARSIVISAADREVCYHNLAAQVRLLFTSEPT